MSTQLTCLRKKEAQTEWAQRGVGREETSELTGTQRMQGLLGHFSELALLLPKAEPL